jgi:outer membrane protein
MVILYKSLRYCLLYSFVASVLGLSFLQQAFAVSLNESLATAYKNNPELKAARENLKAVDENMPSAISGWLPQVSANFEKGRRKTDIGDISTKNDADDHDISLTQPLFRGGRTIATMKQAKNSIKAGRADLRRSEQDILLEAITAHMDILRDTEFLELNKNNVAVLQKHLDVTNERFSLGEVTRTDVAQARASLAQAQSGQISAGGSIDSSRAAYIRIVGAEPVMLEPVETPVEVKASLDEIIQLAFKENPILKSAEYNAAYAKNSVTIQEGRLLPNVDFVANKAKQVGSLSANGLDIESETYAVRVAIPIYQSGAEYSNIRRAKADSRRLKYELIDQQNKVRQSVITAYNDLQVARSTIESSNTVIESSEIALRGTEAEARVGARTTLDVLDAEQSLFQARANLISAKHNEIVSSYTLLAQIGRLNAEGLDLDVDVYNPKKNYNKRKYQIIGF